MHAAKVLGIEKNSLRLPQIVSSNIGGTGTLIGDPPNILIGSLMLLGFMDFLWAMFLPVCLMLVVTERFTAWYFKDEYAQARPVEIHDRMHLKNVPLLKCSLAVLALVFAGFVTHHLTDMPTCIPAFTGAVAIWTLQHYFYVRDVRHGRTAVEQEHHFTRIFTREVDWTTLYFFFFLFVVVGASVSVGNIALVADVMKWLIFATQAWLGLDPMMTLVLAALIIMFVSALVSGFLDNIPFTMLAIPIVIMLSNDLGDPTHALAWALAFGACLGGNLTPIGASANVVVLGMAEHEGEKVGFGEYMRYGAPVTAITIAIAAAYLVLFILIGQIAALGMVAIATAILCFVWYVLPQRKARIELVGQ
jgi:Na+/H+ antiporter NhaD/arsenite permease-like protein